MDLLLVWRAMEGGEMRPRETLFKDTQERVGEWMKDPDYDFDVMIDVITDCATALEFAHEEIARLKGVIATFGRNEE